MPKTMQDGKEGWLTQSKRYYCRREPNKDTWTHIAYYTLEGKRIQLAKGTCSNCGDTIESKMCGDFVRCKCGKENEVRSCEINLSLRKGTV